MVVAAYVFCYIICYKIYSLLLMVYCCKVLNCIHMCDSYFLCYMYILVYLQHSCTFLLHIRLFLVCIMSIFLISLVTQKYLYMIPVVLTCHDLTAFFSMVNICLASTFTLVPIQCFHMTEGGRLKNNMPFFLLSYQAL